MAVELDSRDHEVDLRYSRTDSSRWTYLIASWPTDGSDSPGDRSFDGSDEGGEFLSIHRSYGNLDDQGE